MKKTCQLVQLPRITENWLKRNVDCRKSHKVGESGLLEFACSVSEMPVLLKQTEEMSTVIHLCFYLIRTVAFPYFQTKSVFENQFDVCHLTELLAKENNLYKRRFVEQYLVMQVN